MRVTIVLNDKNNEKLRKIQAIRIKNEQRNISFSRVINDELEKIL